MELARPVVKARWRVALKDWKALSPDQKAEAVKSLYEAGDEPRVIIQKLVNAGYENFTRNSVMGLLNRKGYFGLATGVFRKQQVKVTPRPKQKPAGHPAHMPKTMDGRPRLGPPPPRRELADHAPAPKPAPKSKPVPFVSATFRHCKWPLWGNDPITDVDSLMVCGAARANTAGPYCEFHRSRGRGGIPGEHD